MPAKVELGLIKTISEWWSQLRRAIVRPEFFLRSLRRCRDTGGLDPRLDAHRDGWHPAAKKRGLQAVRVARTTVPPLLISSFFVRERDAL